MKIRFTGLFLLASLLLLSACGQKGPLYLEQEPKAAAAPEKDAVQNKTDEKEDKEEKTEAKE